MAIPKEALILGAETRAPLTGWLSRRTFLSELGYALVSF